jgi:hypothetical protein
MLLIIVKAEEMEHKKVMNVLNVAKVVIGIKIIIS